MPIPTRGRGLITAGAILVGVYLIPVVAVLVFALRYLIDVMRGVMEGGGGDLSGHIVLLTSAPVPTVVCWHCPPRGRTLKAARTGEGRDRGVDPGGMRVARECSPDRGCHMGIVRR